MAYNPGMQRGMPQRSAGAQPGQFGQQQGMQTGGGMQRRQPPPTQRRMAPPAPTPAQAGMRPQREPTVGESLTAQSSGFGASPQEEQFLVNLGIGALKSAHDMGLQRDQRTPGMQPPPNQQRMESFRQNMRTPSYGSPEAPNIQQRREQAMNPRQVNPQMFQQQGPPQPPPGYGGFGTGQQSMQQQQPWSPMQQQQQQQPWSPMQQPQGFGAMQQQFQPQFQPQNMGFYNPYMR
jgi:hypothetical protein